MPTTTTPTPTRSFTGLWLHREIIEADLTWIQRVLWAEIYALYCEEHGGCFASNAYLSNVLGVSEGTIANSLTRLRELEWIVDLNFDGRMRIMRAVFAPFKKRAPEAVKPLKLEAPAVETPALLPVIPDEELIYAEYPRKVQKADALKAIRKALRKVPFDELLKKVKHYATIRAGKEAQFTPYPASFFNAEEYNDHDHEPATQQANLWD